MTDMYVFYETFDRVDPHSTVVPEEDLQSYLEKATKLIGDRLYFTIDYRDVNRWMHEPMSEIFIPHDAVRRIWSQRVSENRDVRREKLFTDIKLAEERINND